MEMINYLYANLLSEKMNVLFGRVDARLWIVKDDKTLVGEGFAEGVYKKD